MVIGVDANFVYGHRAFLRACGTCTGLARLSRYVYILLSDNMDREYCWITNVHSASAQLATQRVASVDEVYSHI